MLFRSSYQEKFNIESLDDATLQALLDDLPRDEHTMPQISYLMDIDLNKLNVFVLNNNLESKLLPFLKHRMEDCLLFVNQKFFHVKVLQ